MTDETINKFRAAAQGAIALDLAFIGVVRGLFTALARLGTASAGRLAEAAGCAPGYVAVWCDAAYAAGLLEAEGDQFRLSPAGAAFRPEAEPSLMPVALQAMISAHMAERAAEFMKDGKRPGEEVLFERATIAPWFEAMLEANFGPFFEKTILPELDFFAAIDAEGGLVLDLGCGNGWYLRRLAKRFGNLRGVGVDGFEGNVKAAAAKAREEGLEGRLSFQLGDARQAGLSEKADAIVLNRALHHMWEAGVGEFLTHLGTLAKLGGWLVIWEPNWPKERSRLREPAYTRMAFQNLSEYVQGNHLLNAEEIAEALAAAGLGSPEIRLFADGTEAVITARFLTLR
jgi:SAM-dependent methyltransferase